MSDRSSPEAEYKVAEPSTPKLCILAMTTQLTSHRCLRLVSLTLVGFLAGCRAPVSTTTAPSPTPTPDRKSVAVQPSSPERAAGIIREIPEHPVWLQLLNASEEIPAQEGVGLRRGETLRTQGSGLAQIELNHGPKLRLGGDSSLTLQPDLSLHLSKGEMLVWVDPGRSAPIKIVLPGVIVRTQDSTLSVKIPTSPKEDMELVAWEGIVTLQLPEHSEQIQLKAGETVSLKQDAIDLYQVRASVRPLSGPEWLDHRFQSRLVDSFNSPLPTLAQLEQTAPPKSIMDASIRDRPTPVALAQKSIPRRPAPRPPRPMTPSPVPTQNFPVVSQTPTPRPPRPVTPSPAPTQNFPVVSQTPTPRPTLNPVSLALLQASVETPSQTTSPSPDGGRFAEFNPYLPNSQRNSSPEQMQSFCERFPLNSKCTKTE